jgi:serine/threonine protein kinase
MAGLVGQSLDHYRLEEQVGQGGMATVFRAVDLRRNTDVAVKVLSPTIGADRRFLIRFRREAEVVSRLDHPNIVRVLDYGQSLGMVYLVMPFVRGETLHDRMVKKRVTQAQAAAWIDQISGALQFAHEHGIVHRDVKPSNILIDLEGKAHLTDFGLARLVEGANTLTGSMLMGTPAYVSPEQAKGSRGLDARSDQYSLGVILYQLGAGRLPFDSESPLETVNSHIARAPIPPRNFNRDLSPLVERVILKSLAKLPEQRFASVAALNQAYQAALRGEAVPGLEVVPRPPAAVDTRVIQHVSARPEPQRRSASPLTWVIGAALAVGLILAAVLIVPSLPFFRSTATPAPAALPQPSPTVTSAPVLVVASGGDGSAAGPTATPVVGVGCPASVQMFGFKQTGDTVTWTLLNDSSAPLQVVALIPAYPDSNLLREVRLGRAVLAASESGLTQDQELTLPRDESTQLPAGQTRELSLRYTWGDPDPIYTLMLSFDSGCSKTTEFAISPP